MKWAKPPLNKIYEALGAIADNRIEIEGNSAKVYSSSRNKYYEVEYDPNHNEITSNDNASFWVGYLGYPSIAFLLAKDIVDYDKELLKYLKGFAWKDINQKFKNDFAKTDAYIDARVVEKYNINIDDFHKKLHAILEQVVALRLKKLGKTKKPPAGY
ncbi:MAG: hypothetical protein QG675_613 [Patescibacteria group bacterium]|jgi:hypothetical protein|nr:hypothetical protein [Patescibacteria group bacterium]